MKNKDDLFIDMDYVIEHLLSEHGIPYLDIDQFKELGQRTVAVYNLIPAAKSITFSELCEYIKAFISTPFGANVLKQIERGETC